MTIECRGEHISDFALWAKSAASFPSICSIWAHMWSTAEYHDGHNGDVNGDSDGMEST